MGRLKKKILDGPSAGCAHVQTRRDYDNVDVDVVVTIRRGNSNTQTHTVSTPLSVREQARVFVGSVSISLVARSTCIELR